jgi:P-type Ca2+ transporter type 2C
MADVTAREMRRLEAPWTVAADAVAQALAVDAETGLDAAEAERRLAQFGANELREGRRRGPARMLLDQFTDFMILVLLAAALVAGFVGDFADTVVILAIVLLNSVIGFVQEYRAERAVAALKTLAAPLATTVRSGAVATIAAAELVPGDVVLLEAGNIVPADLRLVEVHALKIEEAALTGESAAVEKTVHPLAGADLVPGQRHNMAFKGTVATYGRGRGVVAATGMQTELGQIARLLHADVDLKTPLQQRLQRFGRTITLVVIALCALLFAGGVLRGEPVALMLLTAISLAVAAIPEALPAVVTLALAFGARRMVQRRALVRRLPAVETLGSVTYICSDKTGTLTLNRMRVDALAAAGRRVNETAVPAGEPWITLMRALALSNDARVGDGTVIGDPTEVALYEAAEAAGFDKAALLREAPRVAEIPFDSERARMTTIHKDRFPPTPPLPPTRERARGEGERQSARFAVYCKGAPESVLPFCRDQLGTNGVAALDAPALAAQAARMAADGLRVLAVAWRRFDALPDTVDAATVERDLTFVGFAGLLDPPRAEALESVRLCRSAGITPVMITGDHPATARAIARRLDIAGDDDAVLTGADLEALSSDELARAVERVRVYARVAPAQKIRIVQALQQRGEFVAMTGDGVNDAPALKRADIGVAMGVTGTDVAKEAAHMILLDDNFATIVGAVREGRRIFDNIRSFVKYTMTSNSGEIWTLFLAPFLGLPIPLLPIHILWINLVTDGLPGLALTAEPEARGVMQRPPRPPAQGIFAEGMWQHIAWVGLLMGGLCLVTQAWALRAGSANWQTMVFTVLTLSQMGHALAVRSQRDSLFTLGLWSNRPLVGAVLLTFALQLALIYVPAFNAVFHTQPLNPAELGFCLLLSSGIFLAVEAEKWLVRRGRLYAT